MGANDLRLSVANKLLWIRVLVTALMGKAEKEEKAFFTEAFFPFKLVSCVVVDFEGIFVL